MSEPIEDKLDELLAFAEKHGLMEMAWQEEGVRIAFRRNPVAAKSSPDAKADEAAPAPEPEILVRSPMVGTFRRAMSKNHPPLVMVGNHVKPGERMGIVECMKIPTDVVSYGAGEIKKILIEDGKTVEYGQPLFSITPFESPASNGNGNGNGNGKH